VAWQIRASKAKTTALLMAYSVLVMVAHFEKVFCDICNITCLIFFLATISHNMTPREGFTLFGSFFEYLMPDQTSCNVFMSYLIFIHKCVIFDRRHLNLFLQIFIYILYFCELELFSYDFSKINVINGKIAMPRALPLV
jgi:hypothetical protein